MKYKRWGDTNTVLKHIFASKRTKVTLYIASVLWIAVITQMFVNSVFQEELKITEAFVKSDTEAMKSGLEIVTEYTSGFLSETGKRDIIYSIAESIGLVIDDELTIWEEDGRSEYFFYKHAKEAVTEIKVISLEQEENDTVKIRHYIIVRLSITKGIQSIDRYKEILEKELDRLGTGEKQVILKFEGSREGNLTNTQKREIAALLVDELQGEIAIDYDEGDLYTVYAYTGMLKEYVTSLGNKINIQIAITYNELTNKTKITLATPLLNEGW